MKIHRIHLKNFKGVEDSEIVFELDGVTIVEGPNEVGKSSLSEALTLVLEELDSSTKAAVRSAKPVHRDEGPWVEVELSTGDYHLVIEKRWLKSPMTHLRIIAPRASEESGRSAHERLRAILDETLDEQLFSALHHFQGVSLEQAALGASASLSAALDAAATGASNIGQQETSLMDLVEQEWLRHFTAGGRPVAERNGLIQKVHELEASIGSAETDIRSLEALAEEHRRLLGEAVRLRVAAGENAESLQRETELSGAVRERQLLVANARTAETAAESALSEASRRVNERDILKLTEESVSAALASAHSEAEKDEPVLAAVGAGVAAATAERERARVNRDGAESAEQSAQRNVDYHARLTSRELWKDRLDNAREGQSAMAAARAILAANLVDESRLEVLEEAWLAVVEARAQADASSTEVRLEALKSVEVEIDGRSRDLSAGEELIEHVEGELAIKIDESVVMHVTVGGSQHEILSIVERTEGDLRTLLTESGLRADATAAEFRLVAQQRRDAVSQETNAQRRVAENLRDLSLERLQQEYEDDAAFVDTFVQEATSGNLLPETIDDARRALGERTRVRESAVSAVSAAETAFDAAHERQAEAEEAASQRTTNVQIAISQMDAAAGALALARTERSDQELADALETQTRAFELAHDALSAAQLTLRDLDPESVDTRLTNLRNIEERIARELRETEERILETKTTLSVKGDEGLHDRLEALRSEHERGVLARDRRERAAAAVHLTRKTLRAHRDTMQRSYVAPYRAEIERLGRIVYGTHFSVEIDHATLGIEMRSLNGVTLPFNLLSVGAREQLCILSRLACAAIVSRDDGDGAPVIIDDALGWSDRERLERMGAAISAASERSQVIVLTCEPSRYTSVGNAVVRRLTAVRDTN